MGILTHNMIKQKFTYVLILLFISVSGYSQTIFGKWNSYDEETLPEVVANLSDSRAFYQTSFVQDVTDIRQEEIHLYDSLALLIIVFLLFIIIITMINKC